MLGPMGAHVCALIKELKISRYIGAIGEGNLKFKDIVLGQYKGPENYKICLRTLSLVI
jgi:hypothetical protein